jgi:hypothetical protein
VVDPVGRTFAGGHEEKTVLDLKTEAVSLFLGKELKLGPGDDLTSPDHQGLVLLDSDSGEYSLAALAEIEASLELG